MALSDDLKKTIHGDVDTSPETLEKYSTDASIFKVRPEVVVHPKDAADVEALVNFAREKKKTGEKISLTPRAAGTDMSGGPLGESIVLDMTTHFNRIHEVGEGYAVTDPGVFFRDFDKETKKKNLEMPGYPASRNLATVGGMVANNAGGEKNLKFGKTGRYVEELDVVLSDGEKHTFKKLEGEALREKLSEQSFEGTLYRKVAELVSKNRKTIADARPKVTKNSAGYALWDIGDGEKTLNMIPLLVGSQGALGIITKIRFSLIHPEPYSSMAVILLNDQKNLGTIIQKVLTHSPDSFESYDDKTLSLAARYYTEFGTQLKKNIFSLTLAFLPELFGYVMGTLPKLVLLVEFRGTTQEEALGKTLQLAREIRETVHVPVNIAGNQRAAEKYWAIRRASFLLLRKKAGEGMKTAPFIDDFVVLPSLLPEFLPKLQEILSHYDLLYTIAGHVGDGNFHIIPLIDPKKPGMAKVIEELSHKVFDLVLSYKGSISGEHNDGLVRTPYVRQMFGEEMTKLFEDVERIFDPDGIFNPGKKVGTSFADSVKRMDVAK